MSQKQWLKLVGQTTTAIGPSLILFKLRGSLDCGLNQFAAGIRPSAFGVRCSLLHDHRDVAYLQPTSID